MDQYEGTIETGTSELIYDLSPNSEWENIHRVTMPNDRCRGVMRTFEDWAELAARTHAFKTGKAVRLWAQPYQLDVMDFFLAREFEPNDPSLLQRVVAGLDEDLSLGFHDEPDGRRDWCVYSWDGLLRIPLSKTIGVPTSLDELRALNKTA